MPLELLDLLPEQKPRMDAEDARKIVGLGIEAMEPEGELVAQWEGFAGFIHNWSFHDEVVPLEGLWNCRISLEKMEADARAGDLLLVGAKMGLSAVFLAANNPCFLMLGERGPDHDDITPLVQAGLRALEQARLEDPADPTIRFDYDFEEKLARGKREVEGRMEKHWLGDILDRVIKPNHG